MTDESSRGPRTSAKNDASGITVPAEQSATSEEQALNYQQRAREYCQRFLLLQEQEPGLPSGKHFDRVHNRVLTALQKALTNQPNVINQFFKKFRFVTPENRRGISSFLQAVKDKPVRTSLREYVRFAVRFNVRYILESEPPFFRVESPRLRGVTFWVRINNGRLLPAVGSGPHWSELADFYHQSLRLPAGSESLFDSGKAKWFVIDDDAGDSLLAEIEEVSYDLDAIVFVVHRSGRQSFLFCLVGENVTDGDWRKAARVKAHFQREQYRTATRGRTPNLEKRKKEYEALQSHEPRKNIAADIAGEIAARRGNEVTGKQVFSEVRQLSRRASELKQRD